MLWSLLLMGLPSRHTTARMRAWRALKAGGAAVLHDGVYLLPGSATADALFEAVADDVRAQGGQARRLPTEAAPETFAALFDRGAEWQALIVELDRLRAELLGPPAPAIADARRRWRRLQRDLDQLRGIDFFGGPAQRQAGALGDELEALLQAREHDGEPQARPGQIQRLALADHQGRTWVSRSRPWIDRLACAWLIRSRIDPQARILWLDKPQEAPDDALGFDFDGARFSHVGERVSFEHLLAAFGLDGPGLTRVGRLVHALDIGGARPPEAAGIERVLAGMRQAVTDDAQLAQLAAGVFEGLLIGFDEEDSP